MKIINYIFMLNIVLIAHCLYAQDENEIKPQIKTKRIIINNSSNVDIKNSAQIKNPSFILKISPLSFFKGEFPIHFEKSLTKKISFEVTPFLTGKELGLDYLLDDGSPFLYPFERIQDQQNLTFSNTKFKKSFGLRGEIRIYPDVIFDGYYFGIAASAKKHNIMTDISEPYTKNNLFYNQNHSYYSSDFRLTFGHQTTLGDADNVYIEWAFGIGNRVYKASDYPIYSYDNISYHVEYKNLEISKLAFFANFKLGFTF